MIHVSDVTAALAWYARAFPQAVRKSLVMPTFEFEYLDVDGVMLELVPADEKVSSGASGAVVLLEGARFRSSTRAFSGHGCHALSRAGRD